MKRILFIEDEKAIQKTMGEFLKKKGYNVISAFDGETGLKMVKVKKPDLVLLDLVLPKLHGFDLLEKIKADPETEKIPVIILTNLEGTEEVTKALELGATTYLVKSSYRLQDVLSKIKQVLK
ncbi:MAG: response regulator [Candidatus Pacebacteria bacterium]|nr:response regulator [Candidatus Paceibacterota bacterium]